MLSMVGAQAPGRASANLPRESQEDATFTRGQTIISAPLVLISRRTDQEDIDYNNTSSPETELDDVTGKGPCL